MASPEWSSILELYQHIVCRGVVQYLEQHGQKRFKRGIYTAQVVLWLMILQALQRGGTLASAVQMLREGAAAPLLSRCRRVRRKRISGRTGGYCQARLKLPKLLCRQVSQEILERLRQILNPEGQPPRSPEMMEKHLLMAISAYNLVRAVACLAARRSCIDPRQLSFTQVLTLVDAAWHKLVTAPTQQQHDREFFRLLDLAAQCTLPKRTKRRSYPRLQWRRGDLRFRKSEEN